MSALTSLARFLWDFVVGDDWRIAVGVVLALGVTALIAESSSAAWVVLPITVAALLVFSVYRASASRR